MSASKDYYSLISLLRDRVKKYRFQENSSRVRNNIKRCVKRCLEKNKQRFHIANFDTFVKEYPGVKSLIWMVFSEEDEIIDFHIFENGVEVIVLLSFDAPVVDMNIDVHVLNSIT